MKKVFSLIILWLSLMLLNIPLGFTQDKKAVDSLFYRGITAYRQEEYQDALDILRFLNNVYNQHHRITGSLLIQGKALYKLGKYSDALELFEQLIREYPKSTYYDDGLFGMAQTFYRLHQYEKSVFYFLETILQSEDDRLIRKAAKVSTEIMDYCMDTDDFYRLLDEVQDERSQAAITLRLAEREIEKERYNGARQVLQNFLRRYPKSNYVLQMEQQLSHIDKLGEETIKFGAILPLSGSFEEQGKALLSGIKYAIDQYNSKNGIKIELLVEDSEGRVLTAIRAAQKLCQHDGIIALIGELESDITAAIGAVAQSENVVCLAPVGIEEGLTSIGSFVFQLNSDTKIRAELLAEYAVSGLGLKRFVIFYPADQYGQSMRDGFKVKVESLGGEIFAEKWYFEDAEMLRPQFQSIREMGLKKMIEDSMIVLITEEELESQPPEEDILYTTQTFSDLVDSTELEIELIDGIFMPVYTEDLTLTISQFAEFNFNTHVFGGVPWYNEEILNDLAKTIDKKYIDGVIFLSDYYVDPSNYQFYRFRDDYRKTMKRNPEKFDVFGYNATSLLLNTLNNHPYDGPMIRNQLMQTRYISVTGAEIAFNEQRVNPSVYLLQFKGGKVIRIK